MILMERCFDLHELRLGLVSLILRHICCQQVAPPNLRMGTVEATAEVARLFNFASGFGVGEPEYAANNFSTQTIITLPASALGYNETIRQHYFLGSS